MVEGIVSQIFQIIDGYALYRGYVEMMEADETEKWTCTLRFIGLVAAFALDLIFLI